MFFKKTTSFILSLILFIGFAEISFFARAEGSEFDLRELSTLPANMATQNELIVQSINSRGAPNIEVTDFHVTPCYRLLNTQTGEYISLSELVLNIDPQATVVLGEFHYSKNIQLAEAALILLLADADKPVAWEFLEFPDQRFHSKSFELFTQNRLTAVSVTDLQFPLLPNSYHAMYSPIMTAIKEKGTTVIATNAPRAVKQELMDFGFKNLGTEFQPPLFSMNNASEDYFERFKEALGGGEHLPRPIETYFEAQFYTDEVIAWKAQNARILVIGTFHSDFNDGIIPRLQAYSSRPVTHIKVVDAELFTQEEIDEFLEGSPVYGPYADYIFITEAPRHRCNSHR